MGTQPTPRARRAGQHGRRRRLLTNGAAHERVARALAGRRAEPSVGGHDVLQVLAARQVLAQGRGLDPGLGDLHHCERPPQVEVPDLGGVQAMELGAGAGGEEVEDSGRVGAAAGGAGVAEGLLHVGFDFLKGAGGWGEAA